MKMKRLALSALMLSAAPLFAGEAENQTELFQKLDTNGDSQLTKDEIPVEQRRFFERLLRIGDGDSDGQLTRKEFVSALAKREEPVSAPVAAPREGDRPANRGDFNPRELFERLDQNKDGKVTREELPEAMRERLQPLFEKLGKNSITAGDLEQMRPKGDAAPQRPNKEAMIAHLKEMDVNGDGKITQDEVPERAKERIAAVLARTGGDSVDIATVVALIEREGDGPRAEGDRPREGAQREGDRPREGAPREGDRPRPEGDRPREGGARPEGDRPREGGARPEGDRPREGGPRPDGDRPREGAGPRDSDRPGPPPEQRFRPAFMRTWDTNNDGKLSREEVEKAAQFFKQLDRNGDGFLDGPELMGFERPPGDGGPRPEGGPRDGDRPRPEVDRPREGDRPRPEADRPREGDRPRPEADRPREGDRPRPEGDRPRGEGDRPRPEGDRPRGEGDRPRPAADR